MGLSVRNKTVSIVIPFFQEGDNIRKIMAEVDQVILRLQDRYNFEVLLVDNHSKDNSFQIACELAQSRSYMKVVRLSRNYGYQNSIFTGYCLATGNAVIQLDSDGEDDPRLIETFLEKWEAGAKVVYGIRLIRQESAILSLQRKFFYRILNRLSDVPVPVDSGDFRLIDRVVVNELKSLPERLLYLRGLIASLGFEQIGIPYERRARYGGESKFSWLGYLQLAVDGITSFSTRPLRLATFLGILISFASFLGFCFYLGLFLFVGVPVAGFTTLVLTQLFLAGVQLLSIGIVGAYIGRIFIEVKQRPRSVVETVVSGQERIRSDEQISQSL